MLLLIPLLPFVGFLVNASFGRRLSKAVSAAWRSSVMFASFAVSVWASWSLVSLPASGRVIDEVLFTWISSGDLQVPFALRLDPLSTVMILVVSGIGSLIHLYSTAYMHEERDSEYARYFSYLNLFAAFMLVLVLAPNFLVMFVGWEGVGLCSYLLIGFWYHKKSASDAGKKAFIVNRIGDFGFLLGVLLIFSRFGTLDFQAVAEAVSAYAPETAAFGTLSIAALLLFVGATGKSAQIPLYVWLPDAMEGPTPVSALIHAATMVTAGVYMIGRNAVLFTHAPGVLELVGIVGVATAVVAATIGLVQNDIKRVLAYSTVSQLGLMFVAMGVGAYAAGIFHLYTHAFFKALLFLGSGAVIHALAGEQDLRRMGGLKKDLPVTYWTFLAGTLAIAGFPFLSGFFSKDELLYRAFSSGHPYLWFFASVTSLLTACYMFRLFFLTFHGKRAEASPAARPRRARLGALAVHAASGGHLHDAPRPMAIALVVLAVGACSPATSACRRCSAAPTGSSTSSSRASRSRRPDAAGAAEHAAPAAGECGRGAGRRARGARGAPDARLDAGRVHRHRPGVAVLPEAARSRRRGGGPVPRPPPAAAEQVLRGRGLRRGHRAAGAHRLGAGVVEGRGRRRHRRRGERRRRDRDEPQRPAAAAADRVDSRLRRVADDRGGGDPRVLPVATIGRQS